MIHFINVIINVIIINIIIDIIDYLLLILSLTLFSLLLIIGELLDYLDITQIVTLECVSNSLKSVIAECSYWSRNILLYCPHKVKYSIPRIDLRDIIIKHIIKKNKCVEFICKMKNQRSVKRQDSIQPHRHNKNERSVTHPLPVFETRNNISNNTSVYGGNMIMSRAETLNSDFRCVALKTLEIMFNITNCCVDHIVHNTLASEGVVTVLVSLLSNEASILQHYSCGILANMLCWECHKNNLMNRLDNNNDNLNHIRTDHVSTEQTSLSTPLAKQLQACGGQGLLIGNIFICYANVLYIL